MATIIRVAGADFSANAVGFIPPVSSGLVYWGLFGDTLAKTTRNLAPGASAATAVGNPGISAGYASFLPANNYISTGLVDTTSLTYLFVARSTSDMVSTTNRPFYMGVSGLLAGSGIYAYQVNGAMPAVNLRFTATVSVGGTPTNKILVQTIANLSTWSFIGATLDSGVAMNTYNKTDGTTATLATPDPHLITPTTILRVGSGVGGYGGAHDMAFAAVYNRALTSAEITTVYAFVKSYLATRSITV